MVYNVWNALLGKAMVWPFHVLILWVFACCERERWTVTELHIHYNCFFVNCMSRIWAVSPEMLLQCISFFMTSYLGNAKCFYLLKEVVMMLNMVFLQSALWCPNTWSADKNTCKSTQLYLFVNNFSLSR